MDRMLYVAMTGASQTMQAQAVNAHNLANASTTGFREDLLGFTDVEIEGPGYPTRVYSVLGPESFKQSPGPQLVTGNDLDVAIDGDGWIAVQSPIGLEAYTRAGNLRVTPNGTLVTGAGHPVLGDSGAPIAIPPAEKIEIGIDGTISIRPIGQTPEALAVVDRIKLARPDPATLTKGPDGMIYTQDGLPAPADAAVRLTTGALEGSNVNTIDAMVNMIALSRQFEMQIKMMQAAEENDEASARLMQI
jgi:flagellar basal-body rod protein FlgF